MIALLLRENATTPLILFDVFPNYVELARFMRRMNVTMESVDTVTSSQEGCTFSQKLLVVNDFRYSDKILFMCLVNNK